MPPKSPTPTIDTLLNLVPDSPTTILTHLSTHPHLASAQDSHGYSLLHAAASYDQLALLRALVQTYNVSPNIADEDSDTPLFAAESVDVARCLVDDLGADPDWRNAEGVTAREKMEDEDEWPEVAAYLRERERKKKKTGSGSSSNGAGADKADGETVADGEPATAEDEDGARRLPPLPEGVKINVGTMEEPGDEEQAPDPEFRRRIEELAARDDFQGEEGQRELRSLVMEAVAGLTLDGQGREARRRVE